MSTYGLFENESDAFKEAITFVRDQIRAQDTYKEVPDGFYRGYLKRMEVKLSKSGKMMFSAGIRITESQDGSTEYAGSWVWFNRVLSGNRNSAKWDDGKAMQSVIRWIFDATGISLEYDSIDRFASGLSSIELDEKFKVNLAYRKNDFNSVSVGRVDSIEHS